MPNKILLKRSSVVGKLPQPSDLDYGELSINYADGILFHKNSSNYVTTVNATIANGNVNAVAFLNNANTLVTSAALIYNPTTGNLTTTGFLGTHWGQVAATTANVSGIAIVSGNLVAAATTVSTSTTTGALVVTGGVGITGNINIGGSAGNAVVTTANIAASNMNVTGGFYVNGSLITSGSSTTPNFVQTANVSLYSSSAAYTTGTFYPTFSNIAGGNTQIGVNSSYTFNATSGNLTAIGFVGTHWGAVAATTANVSSTLTVTGNTAVNNTLYAQGVFDNSVRVVSTSSGAGNLTITGSSIALTTTGGAGTYGSATQVPVFTTDAYGRVISTSNTAITFPALPNFVQTANVSLYSSSAAYTTGTFYPTFSNIAGGNTQIGVSTGLTFNAATGNLTTAGIVGTTIWGAVAATTANVSSTATINGNLVAAATTVSTNITSGALVVTGGVGIAGNINIGGSAGNAVVTTANIAASNMNVTGGFYVNGSLLTSGSGTQNFVQTANVSLYEQVSAYTTGTFFPMFSNTVTNQGNTTTGVASGFTYNAGTGNLTTAGFVGTTWGAVAAITANVSGVATINGNLVAAATTSSISSTTGALVVNGGVGIGGRTFIGGNTVIANTTQSTSTTSGALVVLGGVGIAGNTYISGNLFVSNLINGSETIRTDSFLQSLNPVVAPLNQLNKGLGSLFFASSFVSTGTSSLTHFAVHPTGSYLYVSNPTTNTVSQYNIDRTTGNLTTIFTAMPTGTGPSSVVVNSNGRYVYVANDTAATISHFSVDQITGNLSLASAAIAAGASARQLAIDPLNRWLYSADAVSSAIIVFSINSTTGVLSNVGATSAAAGPQSLGIDLTGRFLYAGQSLNIGILQFRINQTNGTLTSNSFGSASGNPTAFAFDKSGKFVYVANNNFIDSHILDQTTGSLSFTGNRLSTNGTTGIAVDPAGRFLYFINSNDNLFVVNAINPVTGNITTIQSLSISSGSAARQGVAIDPTGRFVYGLTTANVVSQYAAHNLSAGAALVNANLYIAGNTISSSATTGALVITGGVGVGGNINVTGSFGNAIVATGNIAATNIAVNGGFYVNGSLVRSYVEPNFVQTANVSLFEQVSAYTTGTFYPMFSNTVVNSANTTTGVNTALTYNATNGNLAATGLVGVHWGPVAATTANVSGTLTVSGNTAINNNLYAYQVFSGGAAVITALPNFVQTANVSLYSSTAAYTTGTFYPTFSNIAGGNTQIGVNSSYTFNATSGNLTAIGFVGTHWGPVAATTANVSSTLTVTGNTTVNNTLYAQGVFDNSVRVVSTSSGTGNLTITGSSIALTTTGGAGTYGSATQVPVFTTDAYGRVISTTNTAITFPAAPNFVQTANVSLYSSSAAYTTGTFYPTFSNIAGGNTQIGVSTALTYNATSGNLTTTGFLGTHWGAVAATTANVSSTATINGNLVAAATTVSTNITSGALVVTGGVGIAGRTFIGGNTVIANATTSTSSTTGALVVSGGLGLAGNIINESRIYSGISAGNNVDHYVGSANWPYRSTINAIGTGVGSLGMGMYQFGANSGSIATTLLFNRSSSTSIGNHGLIDNTNGFGIIQFNGSDGTRYLTGAQMTAVVDGTPALNSMPGRISFFTNPGALIASERMRIYSSGNVKIFTTSAATSVSTGSFVTDGGVGIAGETFIGGNTVIANTTISTNTTSGAFIVTGGVGIAGNINIGGSAGNAVVTTANIAASNMNVTGGFYVNGSLINSYVAPNFVQTANVSLYSSTAAYTTGTFYPTFSNIAGGNTQIGVSSGFTFNAATGNLAAAGFVGTHWGALAATTANVSGTLTVSGNTAINNNLYAYQVFSGGAAVITTLPNFVQTANVSLYEQVAAYTTGTFYPMFSNTVVNAANTTTGVNTGLTYNATTGNLISSAGLVSTTLWGAVAATTANVSAATISVSTSTGALVVAGGVGIAGATFIGGNTVIANTTTSTSTTSGALVVSGGVGIAGRLNVSSNVVISSASSSNSKTTGALVITGSGGIGLGGGRITTTDIVADAMYNGGQTGVGGVATGLFQNYGAAIFNFAGANVAYRDPATFPRYSSIIVSSDGNDQSPISGNISTIFFSAPQQFNYGGNGAAISNHFGNIKFNTRINAFLNGPSGQTIDVGTETLILGNTQVSIPLATISTSTNSGALVVSGGAGIGANVNVGGNVAANNSVRINSLTSATKSVSMQYNTVSDSLDFIFT